jgi:hypothetical protein
MSTNHLEHAFRSVERQLLLDLLRAHPEWTLATVFAELERNERRRWLLEALTIGDVLALATPPIVPSDPLPMSSGEIDEALLTLLAEAAGAFVRMRELAARIDVPRYRLQSSLRRLSAAGQVERVGATVCTRYRLVRP